MNITAASTTGPHPVPDEKNMPAPPWPCDDPELIMAVVKWAMSKGAIITRSWFGLPSKSFMTAEEAHRHLTSQGGGNYTSREADNAVSGARAIEGEVYRRLAFHDVAYVIESGVHKGYTVTPKQPAPVTGTAEAEAAALRAYSEVTLTCPEVPEIIPGVREAFYEALEEASARPRTASEHEAAWLREIRDIAADPLATDAQAGKRIRMLLYPPHLPHDGGTAEGCPGCFPPGDALGPYRRPDVHDHEEHRDGTVPGCPACFPRFGGDLAWLLHVIPVVDQHLDDAAPPEYRGNPLANMWRRFSAGPVSEAAEAIDALNGMTGGNPRKGVTHSRTDLLAEAADTAFSALLAIQSQTKDIGQTWMIFTEAAAKAYSRVPDANRPSGRQEEQSRDDGS